MNTSEGMGKVISAARIKARPENRRELCMTISALLDPIRDEEINALLNEFSDSEMDNVCRSYYQNKNRKNFLKRSTKTFVSNVLVNNVQASKRTSPFHFSHTQQRN